jgi:hypothetical protein
MAVMMLYMTPYAVAPPTPGAKDHLGKPLRFLRNPDGRIPITRWVISVLIVAVVLTAAARPIFG